MSGTPEPAGTPSASQSAPARRIAIDPVTRLEGHGRVEILLDPQGEVERAVEDEKYERAAELRDAIRRLSGQEAADGGEYAREHVAPYEDAVDLYAREKRGALRSPDRVDVPPELHLPQNDGEDDGARREEKRGERE